MDEYEKWLEAQWDDENDDSIMVSCGKQEMLRECMEKYKSLSMSLLDRIHAYMESNPELRKEKLSEIDIALTKYRAFKAKAEEPLACLADRKGWTHLPYHSTSVWVIELVKQGEEDEMEPEFIEATTYAAAEQAAREYLNKLEDKK